MAVMTERAQQVQLRGLSEREVLAQRANGKGNKAPLRTSRSYLRIVSENLFTPIYTIMFILGVALVLLRQYSDAVVSVGLVLFNAMVSVVQEIRAKRTLDRIALLTRPKPSVIREGQERHVDPGELVVDDILVVRPGDQIVVDGPIVSDGSLEVDESLLTGESDPISKHMGDMLYSGSFCVSGSACYRAEKVGTQSVASQLTAGARAFRRVLTPLEQGINLSIRVILLLAIFFEILLVIGALFNHLSIVESVKMSVVVLGIVPRGLLLAMSVAYALGAVRIIGKGALVQQANAIESLSNVDMLCLDKTGTLTTNTMIVERMHPFGIQASRLRSLLGDFVANMSVGNVTSAAIGAACDGETRQKFQVLEEVPFSSVHKWSALSADGEALRGVYVLGAPEMLRASLPASAELEALIDAETTQGLRVVLFAFCPELVPLHTLKGEPQLPPNLSVLGVVSLRDELRPEARETLARFAKLGIEVKIISGDHPRTVAALAKQVGLGANAKMVSGGELEKMDTAQLAQVAEETPIFGRITPQQKERLVRALRSRDHYVAMIGDGVNDVLSLKQANLGIAMNSGSQATRSVADIVLLNNSFATLPEVFHEGQRIRNGMHTILKLFLTRVMYVAVLLAATTVVDGFPFVPKQNAILTFLTEGIPTLGLAAWARPGPAPKHVIRSFLHFVLPAGLMISLLGLGVYLAVLFGTGELPHQDWALALAQSALTHFAIICGLLLLPFVEPPTKVWVGGSVLSGDWRPSLLALGLLAGYAVILIIPPLRTFFELATLDIGGSVLIGVSALVWGLLLRWIWRAHLLERFLQVDWKE